MVKSNKSVVEISNLSFSYGKQQVNILNDVNAKIYEGCLTIVLGKNGSGKSTFLRLISGLLLNRSGSIKIYGKELNEIRNYDRARLLSFLPQNHKSVFPFKVSDVVLTGRAPYSGFFPNSKDIQKAHNALSKLNLIHLKDRIYSELSGGEQQLVMISRIIAQETKLIILDEPISHLDFNNQIRVIKLLKKMVAEEFTIVISIHDPNLAFLSGDDFLLVNGGKIICPDNEKPWENSELNEVFNKDISKLDYKNKKLFIPEI